MLYILSIVMINNRLHIFREFFREVFFYLFFNVNTLTYESYADNLKSFELKT